MQREELLREEIDELLKEDGNGIVTQPASENTGILAQGERGM